MIYLDTSVVLAQVFDESMAPPAALWRESLISSRLLAYESGTGFMRAACRPRRWRKRAPCFAP